MNGLADGLEREGTRANGHATHALHSHSFSTAQREREVCNHSHPLTASAHAPALYALLFPCIFLLRRELLVYLFCLFVLSSRFFCQAVSFSLPRTSTNSASNTSFTPSPVTADVSKYL